MTETEEETEKIASLNDMLRQTLLTGEIRLSETIQSFPKELKQQILEGVKNYDRFAPQGDAQKERDFGAFTCGEHDIFWTIDSYDEEGVWTCFNRDDPSKTNRVLKIRLTSEEYF